LLSLSTSLRCAGSPVFCVVGRLFHGLETREAGHRSGKTLLRRPTGKAWALKIAARIVTGSQQGRARQSRETTGLPSWPRSGRCGIARARRNLSSKRLNGGCILGHRRRCDR
jgi:hypothetical protein